MCSAGDPVGSQQGVSPFGHPRIDTCLRLPEAYRSLPRPSSAPIAKAFALRPFLLDLRDYYLNHILLVNCILPQFRLIFPFVCSHLRALHVFHINLFLLLHLLSITLLVIA